jgi:formylglycine-generating enzyme required for sulfatase activity
MYLFVVCLLLGAFPFGATGCGARRAARDDREGRAAAECPAGYVGIAPVSFTMGSPESEEGREDGETQHSVTITRAYCMKATEVTQGEWQAVMGGNPSGFASCGANCPVEQVSWDHAVGYANALSRREGLPECYAGTTFTGLTCTGYRLPTEAEWEYAARAGTMGATYGGNLTIRGERNGPALDPIAWYGGNSGVSYDGAVDCSSWADKQFPSERCGTHPVGQKQPNAWGLYDMLGNVWEWTGDRPGEYSGAVIDPPGPATGSHRVFRGGSWSNTPAYARAAFRNFGTTGHRSGTLGFRLSRTAP